MKQKSIKFNFVMNIILTMSSIIFPLITFPYVSRILLPVGMGKVSFATAIINYFSMFAQLGIPTYGIMACAKVRDNKEALTKTAHELLSINLVMSILTYLALGLALQFVPRLQEEKGLYVIISFTIILNTIGMEWLFKALEQYTYITIRSIIFKLIALIAMFILVQTQDDYILYGGITILAASASNICNFISVRKYIDFRIVGNYNFRRHFKPIGVFFAMTCATTIYANLDSIMLGFIKSDIDVGYYNAAIKIKGILVSIVTALGAVLLPRASYYIEHGNTKEFYRIAKKSLSFIFLIAFPLIIYFIFFAKEGILLLSGIEYIDSIVPMKIIMPTLLFIGLTNILGFQILVPLGKEKIVLYSEIAGAIVNIIVNLILIPLFSSTGAAIGTLVAEFVVLAVQYYSLRNIVGKTFKQIHYTRIITACILGTFIGIWPKFLSLGNFGILCISSVLFFGSYGIFLLLRKEEIIIEMFNFITKKLVRKAKK